MAWIRALLALALLAAASEATAQKAPQPHPLARGNHPEHVRHIDVRIEVMPEGRLRVHEQIDYCFGTEERHGILRSIPLRGWWGRQIGIEVASVEDANGEAVRYRRRDETGSARLRIGDPDRTVTGPQSYRVVYEVEGAIRGEEKFAELQWTAVGGGWEVPVDTASVRVILPPDTVPRDAECRVADRNPYHKIDCVEDLTDIGPHEVGYSLTDALRKTEHFDVRIEFPREAFEAGALSEAPPPPPIRAKPARGPTLKIEPVPTFKVFAVPLVLGPLFLLAGALFGRDRGRPGSVAASSSRPQGMTPAEAQLLHSQRLDRRTVAATILDLAVRGFIEIEPVLDYQVFHKRKDPKQEELEVHEWILFRALFHTSASPQEVNAIASRSADLGADALALLQRQDSATSVPSARLRQTFPAVFGDFEHAIRDLVLHQKKLFVRSPRDQMRGWMAGLACAFALPTLYLTLAAGWLGALAMAMTLGCAFQFVRMLPRRTREGRRRHEEVLGLAEFLNRVEQDRLDRQAPGAAEGIVEPERLLPFALVLGLLEPWREAMRDVHFEPPAWLETTIEGASRITAQDLLVMVDRVGADIDSIPSSAELALQNFEISRSPASSASNWDDSSSSSASSGGSWSGGGGSSGPIGGGGGSSW
jgi:uncharacterized membrane protein YgcG